MNVLILHGIQGKAGENWGQWLNDSLIKKSYNVFMPTLPEPDHPDRNTWYNEIKLIADKQSNNLIIVAHSLGVTSALDYIEQSTFKVKGLVSVSGFADDYGLELNSYFLKKKQINFDKVNKNLEKAFVFYGDNDPYVTQEALKSLAKELKVNPVVIKNGGHLNSSAGFTEFPKLLETVLSIS